MAEFTAKQKAECAAREVKQRARVYPHLVADGRMSQEFADEQTAIMTSIAEDYRRQADAEEPRLL